MNVPESKKRRERRKTETDSEKEREKDRAIRREREKAREKEMCSINIFSVLLCCFFFNFLVQSSLPISFTRKRETMERKYK